MENRKFIKFLIPIFILGFFIININNVFAYDIETHAYLTGEIFNFYNKNFSNQKIPNELKDYLIDGARREDDPIRWMNHFYDPVYNRGLTVDPKIFSARDIASVSIVNIATFGSNWLSSKEWAQNGDNQNKFKYSPVIATILSSLQSDKIQKYFSTSDFTWNAAINYWVNDNKEMAMFTLGHILHLIEDASVPDHVRNDPHPGDSPYELYTQQFTLENKDNSLEKRLNNKNPFILGNLNSYFDELAKYTNNNFYSKDTIGIQSGYKLPEMDYLEKDGDYYYAVKENKDGNYYLFLYKNYKNSLIIESKNNIVLKLDDENKVINDYWSHLSTKSIQYGSGAIDLFFKEAEKAKKEKEIIEKDDKSFFAQTVSLIENFFSGIFSSNQTSQQIQQTLNDLAIVENSVIEQPESIIEEQTEEQPIITSEQIEPKEETKPQEIISKTEEAISNQQTEQIIEDKNSQTISGQTEINAEINSGQSIATTTKVVFKLTSSGDSGSSGSISYGGSYVAPSAPITYPKILITEIQLASASSTYDEFVELYNPNDTSVDLTDWYVQKKTASGSSFSTFAKADLFSGKTISAKSFLLIAHSSSTFAYDIAADYGISDDNTLVIKNPNGEIVDKVGLGEANDCDGSCASNPADGQSAQRKIQSEDFVDTDSNASDFEIQTCPSPKAQSASCQEENQTATSTISHIVISEIYPDKTGNNFDFVELYNSNNSSIEIGNYSLKIRKESATSASSLASFSSGNTISAKSFFLVGLDNYGSSTNATADVLRSSYSLFTSTSSIVYLMDNDAAVDEINYNPANIANSQSLERKAYSTSTVDLMTTGEHRFSGNGYDADSTDDFVLRNSVEPQNSQNLPEPRTSPTTPQNFGVQYSSSTMSLNLSWQASQDYSGTTSTITYKITDISASSTFSEINTTSTTSTISLSENNFGETYNFSIQAFDEDGLNSASSTASVSIPNSTSIIAQQIDKSIFEQGTGNGQFYQYLGNGLLGSPQNITFHAKFDYGWVPLGTFKPYYIQVDFLESDNPDYSSSTAVSTNTCYFSGNYGPLNNCSDVQIDKGVAKDYAIPIQQSFTFNPEKYYKVTFMTYQADIAYFYGSADTNSYFYGKAAKDNGQSAEVDASTVKDLYLKIEAATPIEIPVNISQSIPQNFEANYSSSTLALSLSWDKPRYFDETSPTLIYKINDISYLVSNSTLVLPEITTSATSTTITLSEVGRKYKFSIQGFDANGNSTFIAQSKDISIPYSLLNQFVIAKQIDNSVSEQGTGNGQFYQTLGSGLSGNLGAIVIKVSSPGYYISIYSNGVELARCSANQYYSGPSCSNYYLDANTIAVPAKTNFTFDPATEYKLYFMTYQSNSTFYGSADENSYTNGQSTKDNGNGTEISTSPIKDIYFAIVSTTPL